MQFAIVLGIIFIAYSFLIFRLYDLTILSFNKYENLSKENFIKTVDLPPVRGIIYDRFHNPIAFNELQFNISLKPHLKKDELLNSLEVLKNSLNDINVTYLYKKYKKFDSSYNHKPIVLLKYLQEDIIYKITPFLSLDKNIIVTPTYLRVYPVKEPLANVLGYVSKANRKDLSRNSVIALTKISGKTGIERYYDDILQGEAGKKVVVVNAKNEILKEINYTKPKSSYITLSIDTNLQTYIYNLMKNKKKRGAVVVMRTNGEVLALVTYPSFDNNLFAKGINYKTWNKLLKDIYKPLLNKPINGLYPPASTVKPIEGLIASASGKWNPYEKVECPGFIRVGKRNFRDWLPWGHGEVDLVKSIKRSVDVYYYKIGLKLGINYLASHLKKTGFGFKTGIDLPNEKRGVVPDKNWKMRVYHQPWFIGETLNAVIGQGYFLATPIQVAVNTALIASGKKPVPFISKDINGKTKKPILKDVLTPEEKKYLPLVRKGMWEVCNAEGGTATRHIFTKVEIAGKTGTAQVYSIPQEVKKRKREDELVYFHRSHAWLTTYGPYKNPQFVVTVLVEHGGHGGSAAGGIVSYIYDYLLKNGYIVSK